MVGGVAATYETQGRYTDRSRPKWKTHKSGLTLERAIRCYRWFKYATMEPEENGVNDVRIVNSATREILVSPFINLPKMLFGHLVVPCSTDDWNVRLYSDISHDYLRTEKVMRDGTIEYSYDGGGDVIGFRRTNGTYHIRPRYYILAYA